MHVLSGLIIIIPLFYLLIGFLVKNFHSKFPNTFGGYHIGKMAYLNEDTWETANIFSGTVLIRLSLATLVLNVILTIVQIFLISLIIWPEFLLIYTICTADIPIVFQIIMTETYLKNTFDSNGYRK